MGDASAFVQLCTAVHRLSETKHAKQTLHPRAHPLKQRRYDLTTLRLAHGGGSEDARQRSTERLLHQVTRCRKPSSEARHQCLKIISRQLPGKHGEQANDAGFDAVLWCWIV